METFRIAEKPYGWVLSLGEQVIATFRSRLGAIERANWLCRKLRDLGADANVLMDA